MADSRKALDTVKGILNKAGKFIDVEFDPTRVQAFKASGGKEIARFACEESLCTVEVTVTVDKNDECSVKTMWPCSKILDDKEMQASAPQLFSVAKFFLPGALVFSDHRRVSLVYEFTTSVKDLARLESGVGKLIADGQRMSNAIKSEIRQVNKDTVFDPAKDKLWQSSLGRPVKLSPRELLLAQGGDFWDFSDGVAGGAPDAVADWGGDLFGSGIDPEGPTAPRPTPPRPGGRGR